MKYLAPDYTRSVQSVYIDAARYIIESDRSLELLSHVECRSLSCISKLPSWVPDWSVDGPPVIFGAALPNLFFNASPGLSFETTTSIRGTNLHTRGIFVDTIAEVAEHADRDPLASIAKVLLSIPKIYPNMTKIIDTTDERGVPFPLAMIEPGDDDLTEFAIDEDRCQSRVEAFWRTLLINACGGHKLAPLQYGYAFSDWLHLYLGNAVLRNIHADGNQNLDLLEKFGDVFKDIVGPWVKLASEEPDAAIEPSMDEEVDVTVESKGPIRFLPPYDQDKGYLIKALFRPQDLNIDFGRLQVFQKQLNLANSQRTIYRTSKGLLGNCFCSVKAGDEIWILPGAKVPLIFRRAKDEVGKYMLLGESYVHGIRHGEALLAALSKAIAAFPKAGAVGAWAEGLWDMSQSEVVVKFLEQSQLLQNMIII